MTRWRDALGTALYPSSLGSSSQNQVFHALRSGPIPTTFRNALTPILSTKCSPRDGLNGAECRVSTDGFGTIGQVDYLFDSRQDNRRGKSTQVMVACKCLGFECQNAILMRPVRVVENGSEVGTVCLYQKLEDGYANCHADLFRTQISATTMSSRDRISYSVKDPGRESSWSAFGERAWTFECSRAEVDALPRVNISAIKVGDISKGSFAQKDSRLKSSCVPESGIQLVIDESKEMDNECARTYEKASVAATHRATQQDEIAIGTSKTTYLEAKPGLTGDTELALTCAAVMLGALAIWTTFRKEAAKKSVSYVRVFLVLLVQVVTFVIESLPLHTALLREWDARAWYSYFAYADATLGVGKNGGVMVVTSFVGGVGYSFTRTKLLMWLTVLFDLLGLAIISATLTNRMKHIMVKRILPDLHIHDVDKLHDVVFDDGMV